MSYQQELGIILNPKAGRGNAERIIKHLIECLQKKRISFQLELTKHAGHANEIALRMSNEFKTVVAAGGDGTVNEVVTGIIGTKASLALLPVGSGNDFNKIIRIPKKIDQALDVFIKKQTKLADLGQVVYWDINGIKQKRFFINTLGIGLDAEIANETKQVKYLRGLPLYLLAAIKALRKHMANTYHITSEKRDELVHAFFICIGNGNYEGGGFKLLPDADPYDALLDICVLKISPILKAIKILPSLIKGKHKYNHNVLSWRTKEIIITAKDPFIIHGDGEIFAENAVRAIIDLAPFKIKTILPIVL